MKKLFFFLAALTLSFTAQATVVNCNPGSNNLAWYLTQGDTLVLADGEYSEAFSIDFDKSGVCVKAAEGAKPIIKLTGEWTALEVTATTTFDGITFDAGNVAQYIIATLDSTTFETDLTIKNCEFKNWNHWAISHYYQKNVSVNSIVIDNCLFHDAKNSVVYFSENAPEGKNVCQDLKITNSTFYNIGDASAYTTVYCLGGNAVDAQKVTVDYCTFYNCQAKNTDHAAVRVTCAATISNTIIAAPASQGTYRAIHATDGSNAKAINCLTYNYEKDNGGIRSGATKTDCQLNVDPKFVDAANGNFALADDSPALGAGTDGSNLGDPRWNAPAVEEPKYNVVEDEITNFVFDKEAWPMFCEGGPSANYQIEVFLVLTEAVDGTLSYEDCSVSIMGTDATFIDGTLSNIDPYAPYADAVLHVQWDGDYYELQLAMSSTPAEPITIEAEDATVTLTEYPTNLEGTEFAYELAMVAEWVNEAESLPYTVEFVIPTFDPTKASGEYNANFYVTGEGAAFGMNEGVLVTVTKDGNNVTLTGNVSALNSNAYNVTISGTLPEVPTALDNVDTTVAPAKAIVNGQLVIIKNGVQYNAQGAIVK